MIRTLVRTAPLTLFPRMLILSTCGQGPVVAWRRVSNKQQD